MTVQIFNCDARAQVTTMDAESVHCCVTSLPYYGLRDYGNPDQMGLERTPDEYVAAMVDLFRGIHRVLRADGTLWLNLGDTYASPGSGGHGATGGRDKSTLRGKLPPAGTAPVKRSIPAGLKNKDLIGIPWRVAFALQADGWYLRSAIVWAKPNGMPGSQEDRCTSSYEMVFMLSKSPTYWSDFDAIKTPPRESTLIRTAQDLQAQAGSHRANGGTRTDRPMKAKGGHARPQTGIYAKSKPEQQAEPAMMRDVWFVRPGGFASDHFAVMPEEVARRCILAGCPEGGTVLDPFGGTGTTGLVADRHHRNAVLIELNETYAEIARRRITADATLLSEVIA